ncbi:putative mannose-1-phosphate guanylyltransferase [Violaceomyces palustris]|uniref:Mannose-1-phosphate guanylyltransferase n=1 Tax=Violaceomyces palustris TaxID=1673888 RepID=A0ACD0NW02_9BASI|nr:putative mannose-1-phosphate guanylyltransferase [Violaceomyces palustris]
MGNQASGDSNAVLLQVLAGISEMQKELGRLHMRMDTMEIQNERIARRSSFYGTTPPTSTSPLMARPTSFGRTESNRSLSPEKNHQNALAPHLVMAPPVMAQPAPFLTSEPKLGLWAVVPAGGAGTRLWPLSRESFPKFLLDLTGSGRTLLQSTWDRLLPLAGAKQLMIVTGQAHVNGVSDQLPELDASNLLAEPSPKESMAAIGLAAAVLLRRDPEAVLGSFAADHIISGREAFESAVTEAVAVARDGYLVTIGIAPSYPSTGFGYIKLGEKLGVNGAPNARRVTEFKEKPDARTASAYLSTGDYRWNGGMFVVQAKTLLSLLKQSLPELHDGLERIAAAWDTPDRAAVLADTWDGLPKIAIDHAVAEPAAKLGKVAVVPATFGWDDVGDFSSLADLIPAEKGEARVLGDNRLVVTESQAGGLIVPAAGRTIACLGVDDVVVVDTPDALLITTRARSQDVKKIVARCKKVYPQLC